MNTQWNILPEVLIQDIPSQTYPSPRGKIVRTHSAKYTMYSSTVLSTQCTVTQCSASKQCTVAHSNF